MVNNPKKQPASFPSRKFHISLIHENYLRPSLSLHYPRKETEKLSVNLNLISAVSRDQAKFLFYLDIIACLSKLSWQSGQIDQHS